MADSKSLTRKGQPLFKMTDILTIDKIPGGGRGGNQSDGDGVKDLNR